MRTRVVVVLAFGIAMGYLEATVVVYLRAAIESTTAGGVPAPDAFASYAAVEAVRELATLVLIGAVAWLAGESGWERLAWAAVVFGAWDITYYAGLRVITGWPPALTTWDLLFLVPSPWVGPVWAPIVVSGVLIGFGLAGARWARRGGRRAVRRPLAIAAVVGGLLVVTSFLVDAGRVLAGLGGPWSGWALFWSGMAIAGLATMLALRGMGGARSAGSRESRESREARPEPIER